VKQCSQRGEGFGAECATSSCFLCTPLIRIRVGVKGPSEVTRRSTFIFTMHSQDTHG
jgi:hypothetical protein